MAYDEVLAQRIHDLVDGEAGWTSKKMFGGLGFMLDGHMAVAAGSSGSLMVRADPADGEAWFDGEPVQPMEMRGRPMAGWLLVSQDALASDDQLELWVDRGATYVRTLPAEGAACSRPRASAPTSRKTPAHRGAVAGQHASERAATTVADRAADHDPVPDDAPRQPSRQAPVDAGLGDGPVNRIAAR